MTRTRPTTRTVVVTTLTLLLVAALAVPATASGEAHRARPARVATFEGHAIDLTRGWGDARTCVVWDQDGETTCYRTEQAADAAMDRRDRAASRAAAAPTAASLSLLATGPRTPGSDLPVRLASTCADWLTLYEHSGYAGRSLRFRDRGHFQDLATWGFANRASSFRVGSCGATLRDGSWTGYPGWTGPHATAPSMLAGWNDRIRYLRID